MEEVTNEYIHQQYYTDINDFLFYCITLVKDFREDILKIRRKYNIDVISLRKQLFEFKISFEVCNGKILRFNCSMPRDATFFKYLVTAYKKYMNLSKSQKTKLLQEEYEDILKVEEFEKSLVPEVELNKLTYKYHLARNYKRRLKSVIFYDDYPIAEMCMPAGPNSDDETSKLINYSWSTTQQLNAGIRGQQLELKDLEIFPHFDFDKYEFYYEVRIYGDTDLNILPLKKSTLELFQSTLPDFRQLNTNERELLPRDALYYDLFVNKGYSFKEANAEIKRRGFESYNTEKAASDAKRKFTKLAQDKYEHYSKNRPQKYGYNLPTPQHIPSFD